MSLRYIINKLLYGLIVLWGVVTLVFVLFNVLPGDPARLTLGQRSDVATIEQVRKEMNLDKPVSTRYFLYLNDLSPVSVLPKAEEAKYHYQQLFSVSKEKALVIKAPYMGRSYQSKRL
ncbi:MAG TPA: ABC transporter permease, partial [Edaphocola sp.]|nr:ABC transporter permease [Edaphocola sp.]